MPYINTAKPVQTPDGFPARFIGKTLEGNLIFGVTKPGNNNGMETIIVTSLKGEKFGGGVPELWNIQNVPTPNKKVYICPYDVDGRIKVSLYDAKRDIEKLAFLGQVELIFDGDTNELKSAKVV